MNASMKAAIIGVLLIAALIAVPVGASVSQTATGCQIGTSGSINVAANVNSGSGAITQKAVASQAVATKSINGAVNVNTGNAGWFSSIKQTATANQMFASHSIQVVGNYNGAL
jgi:hypothetical protein